MFKAGSSYETQELCGKVGAEFFFNGVVAGMAGSGYVSTQIDTNEDHVLTLSDSISQSNYTTGFKTGVSNLFPFRAI